MVLLTVSFSNVVAQYVVVAVVVVFDNAAADDDDDENDDDDAVVHFILTIMDTVRVPGFYLAGFSHFSGL